LSWGICQGSGKSVTHHPPSILSLVCRLTRTGLSWVSGGFIYPSSGRVSTWSIGWTWHCVFPKLIRVEIEGAFNQVSTCLS
jgi:hypothetical protein